MAKVNGLNPRFGLPGIGNYLRSQNDNNFQSEKSLALRQSALRQKIATELANIARERRDRYLQSYAPLEKQMADEANQGINPDYESIRTQAINDVNSAFDQQSGISERNAGRYGIMPSPDTNRVLDTARTKGAVFAANNSVNSATDRAEQLNQSRGVQALSLGMGLPSQASVGIAGAGQNLGNALQTEYMNQAIKGEDAMNFGSGIGYGAGASSRLFADGGLVAIGGRPGDTIALRKKYGEYATVEMEGGRKPKEWSEWLADNGYRLAGDGLVSPGGNQPGADTNQRPYGGTPGGDVPRTPDFLFRPRENPSQYPPGYNPGQPQYAEGGIVNRGRTIDGESERVEMDTGDFVIPEDVVQFYGPDFFDTLVQKFSGG